MSTSRSACAVLRRNAAGCKSTLCLTGTGRRCWGTFSITQSSASGSVQKRKMSELAVSGTGIGAYRTVPGMGIRKGGASILPRCGYSHTFSSLPRRQDKTESFKESEISETSSSTDPSLSHLDPSELEIHSLLTTELEPTKINVKDVSGGCGTMYSIEVFSEKFKGMNVLKQQRFVNSILGDRVKGWHGVMIKTGVE